MTKIVYILHRNPKVTRDEFAEACHNLAGAATDVTGTHDALHMAYPSDALRSEPLGKKPQPARCDALYMHTRNHASLSLEKVDAIERTETYRVEEVVHWDRLGQRSPGQTSPGIKMVAFVQRRKELSPADFRKLYLQHALVAREHHPGIARYVQNFIEDTSAQRSVPLDAIAELHFASQEDLQTRFYRDETSPTAIGEDVGRFLAPGLSWSILAQEHILR